MANASYNVTTANLLLEKYFPISSGGSEYVVDNYTLSDKSKRFVFTTTDGTKIIKIIKDSPSIDKGIKMYERFSNSETGCKICKLVTSKKIDDGRIIIVMENCGEDLVDFLNPGKRKITLMQLLQLSSELLKQIICLQNPPDGRAGVVHGDIKLENVAVQVEDDKSLNVRLIDFDYLDEIQVGGGGICSVKISFTAWFSLNGYSERVRNPNSLLITAIVKNNCNFISKVLKPPSEIDPNVTDVKPYFNIPTAIGDKVYKIPNPDMRNIRGSLDYLHIIDLCSWSYIISLALKVYVSIRVESLGLFVYNTLLVVVMNILLPNYGTPAELPVDCSGRRINKEYCDKVVNGLSVLSRLLSESYVQNEDYSHSKAKLFVDLIQACSSSDELYTRFTTIVSANVDFYKKTVDFTHVAAAAAAFDTVTRHIGPAAGVVDAGGDKARCDQLKIDVEVERAAAAAAREEVVLVSKKLADCEAALLEAADNSAQVVDSKVVDSAGAGAGGRGIRTTLRRRRIHKKTYRKCLYKKNKKASKVRRIKNKTKLKRS